MSSAEATAWFVKILFLLKDVCFHLQLIAELICFYTPFVFDVSSIPYLFSAPSSPSLGRTMEKNEADHFSEAQQPPLEGKKRLTHGMKLRNRGHLCVRADSGG